MTLSFDPKTQPIPLLMNIKTRKQAVIVLFFSALLVLGLTCVKDYGISWDESAQRKTGAYSAAYINSALGNIVDVSKIENHAGKTNKLIGLHNHVDKDYGAIFELILIGSEFILKVKDSKDIFILRHTLTFLLFWIALIFFYFLIQEVLHDWRIALLGCVFLLISPRIFADSFYNSKDLPFMSFMIINAFSLVRFLKRKTYTNALFHACCAAIVIDSRIAGIYVPFVTLFFWGTDLVKASNKDGYYFKQLKVLTVYLSSLLTFIYAFWPYLWENPVGNFIQSFQNMAMFRWPFSVLYFGEYIKGTELPWHYVPVWISITTPVAYTLLFILGSLTIIATYLKQPIKIYSSDQEKYLLANLLLFILPLLSVITLGSVLYDGWRQLFFIYPFFIILSLVGLKHLFSSQIITSYKPLYTVLIVAIAMNLGFTINYMVKSHPYQNLYFNFFAGKQLFGKFDLDYWGLSYKEALKFLVNSYQDKQLKVAVENFPGELNAKIIDSDQRSRLCFVPLKEANFYITTFRWEDDLTKYQNKEYPFENQIFSKKIEDNLIVGIFALEQKVASNF